MDHVSKLVETSKVPNAQSVQKVEWVSDAKNVRTVILVIQGKVFKEKVSRDATMDFRFHRKAKSLAIY